MKHASPSSGLLSRLGISIAAAALFVGTTAVLSTASAGAASSGGNEDCAAGQTSIKFDSQDLKNGSITVGGFTVTLSDIRGGNEVTSFDYVASAGLVTVIVKGGPTAYRITSPSLTGNDILGPPNPSSGKTYGVSNVKFCFKAAASPSPSPSKSASMSPSPSKSASVSPTPSKSASVSPSPSRSASVSPSPSPSPSPSASVSPSPSPSASPTLTVSPSPARGSGGGTVVIGGGSGGGAAAPTSTGSPSAGGGDIAVGGGSGGGAGTLPRTGGLGDAALVAALSALGAGLLLMLFGRRRSEPSRS